MMYNRIKNSKSQASNKNITSHPKITTLVGMTKKSDPFYKEFKETNDKENVHPNLKDRVKSHTTKTEHQRSPKQKTSLKQNKTYNHQAYYAIRPATDIHLNSNSKQNHSAQNKPNTRLKSSNRKSTQKDEPAVNHFQQQYYNAREERQSKKMRVTLRDIKKRKSISQMDKEYNFQEETKDSLSRDLLGSLKKELNRHEGLQRSKEKVVKSMGSAEKDSQQSQYRCCTHPDKRASHRLIEDIQRTYCQKCALNLITKGNQMEPLYSKEINTRQSICYEVPRDQRLERLKDFMFQVDRLQPIMQQTHLDLSHHHSQTVSTYQQQKTKVEHFYSRVHEQINISQQRSLLNLKMYFQALDQELQRNEQELQQIKIKLRGIKDDILPNIDNIVKNTKIPDSDFNSVINNYQNELGTVQVSLKTLYEYHYNSYFYNYQKNHHLLLNLRDAIAPEIFMTTAKERDHETHRRGSQQSAQKRMECFRLSFGKQRPQSNYKTL